MTFGIERKLPGENKYRILLSVSGLSQREAAMLHGVTRDAIHGWVYNQSPVPDKRIIQIATAVREVMEYKDILKKELTRRVMLDGAARIPRMFVNDEQAKAHGWRFASQHWQAVRLAVAELPFEAQEKLTDDSAFRKTTVVPAKISPPEELAAQKAAIARVNAKHKEQ